MLRMPSEWKVFEPWSSAWTMIKCLNHDQAFGPWSSVWTMIKCLNHDQVFEPWSSVWTMIKCLNHDQVFEPWSSAWTMINAIFQIDDPEDQDFSQQSRFLHSALQQVFLKIFRIKKWNHLE
jgi:hypothetical protein